MNTTYTYGDPDVPVVGNGQSSTQYRYDRAGNRKLMITDEGTTSYLYDANDQLTNVIKPNYYYEEYEYDARGNLTQVHSYGHGAGAYAHYDYNARDLLVSYGTSSDGIGVTNVALMDYDHRGNRVEMTASSTLNTYLWDEFSRFGDVVLESSLMGSRSYTLANGMLISQNNNGTVGYFLQDVQGSTIGLADDTGALTAEYSYDAFGTVNETIDTESPDTKYLYTGQQYDPYTELYSLRARYYDPTMGRFLTRDTYAYDFENPFELNRYVYTHNNPTTFVDPTGYDDEYAIGTLSIGSVTVPVTYAVGVGVTVILAHILCYLSGCYDPLVDDLSDLINSPGWGDSIASGGTYGGTTAGTAPQLPGIGNGLGEFNDIFTTTVASSITSLLSLVRAETSTTQIDGNDDCLGGLSRQAAAIEYARIAQREYKDRMVLSYAGNKELDGGRLKPVIAVSKVKDWFGICREVVTMSNSAGSRWTNADKLRALTSIGTFIGIAISRGASFYAPVDQIGLGSAEFPGAPTPGHAEAHVLFQILITGGYDGLRTFKAIGLTGPPCRNGTNTDCSSFFRITMPWVAVANYNRPDDIFEAWQ